MAKQINLSTSGLKEIQQGLKNFANSIGRGTSNGVREVTIAFYEIVIRNCEAKHIINDIDDIHWEFDEQTKTGKVFTDNIVIVFNEMGTGIVGSNNPHPNPNLEWKYDVNEHGEKGWIYPKNGTFGWTKGLPSRHMFYDAWNEIKDQIGDKINIEITKLNKDLY